MKQETQKIADLTRLYGNILLWMSARISSGAKFMTAEYFEKASNQILEGTSFKNMDEAKKAINSDTETIFGGDLTTFLESIGWKRNSRALELPE